MTFVCTYMEDQLESLLFDELDHERVVSSKCWLGVFFSARA